MWSLDTVGFALQLAIGLVFARTAFGKARRLTKFADGILDYDIISVAFVLPAARLIVVIEGIVAVTYLTDIGMTTAVPLCLLLLSAFFVAVSTGLVRERKPASCHCGLDESETPLSRLTLIRIAILIAIEVVVALGLPDIGNRLLTALAAPASDTVATALLVAVVLEGLAWSTQADHAGAVLRDSASTLRQTWRRAMSTSPPPGALAHHITSSE